MIEKRTEPHILESHRCQEQQKQLACLWRPFSRVVEFLAIAAMKPSLVPSDCGNGQL